VREGKRLKAVAQQASTRAEKGQVGSPRRRIRLGARSAGRSRGEATGKKEGRAGKSTPLSLRGNGTKIKAGWPLRTLKGGNVKDGVEQEGEIRPNLRQRGDLQNICGSISSSLE